MFLSGTFALTLILAAPKAVIEAPQTRKEGQSILLDGRASQSEQPLEWQIISPSSNLPLLIFDAQGVSSVYAYLPDPEPGEYIFALVAASEGKANVAIHRVVVGPGPGPRPPPGPGPPTGLIHATLIFDLDANDPMIAEIRTNDAIRTEAESLGIVWRNYDDDATAAIKYGFTKKATEVGLPAIIFQENKGKIITTVPCPQTTAGVIELFNIVRGTK